MSCLLLGTKNKGKIVELRQLLSETDIEIRGLDEYPFIPEPDENGVSFDENAAIKAVYYAKAAGCLALADDSGLEVAGLGGRPGVYSARFAGKNASDEENTAKLLDELKGLKGSERNARFRCAMYLADSSGEILYKTSASCDGSISPKPHGINGFGYDPVFIPNNYDKTFGELPDFVKRKLSHRSLAAKNIVNFLSSNSGLVT